MSQKHKSRVRYRPPIESVQNVLTKDEYRECATPECKNVVNRTSGLIFCSRCKN